MKPNISCPEFEQLQACLVPNIDNLDPQVQQQIVQILSDIVHPACDLSHLSVIARQGLLEETPLLKSHIWKMLMDVLPLRCELWAQARGNNQQLYSALREKFCPGHVEDLLAQHGAGECSEVGFDRELWHEIALDTRRTHSTINFFQSEINFTQVYKSKPTRNNDVLTRILYIWGKTNSSVRYVQGMNEIIAPLYYLQFQFLEAGHWDRESEVFTMFSGLMSSIIDMHIKEMDDCDGGILARMLFLHRYLRVADPELWAKMEKQKISPQFYSFRWLALMLSQQFGLYDTIRLWDHVLSYKEQTRFFFIYSLCVAILTIRKSVILQSDFMNSLPLIQKIRDLDVEEVIELGTDLFQKYRKMNINAQFQRLAAEQEMSECQPSSQKHRKSVGWSYADILRQTTSYLARMTQPAKP